ncbi:YitT family protein [Bacillaceae bacterium SIJ1]|uniref:YitT family protein n=1 Tax=Litoribacterium kuwaitense TaxID=1398745 RepID=UPI0013EB275D|nr:YitT family protein [Litoribacterium kuwaitense]NGP44922.1 YitT family protein [Litoribacterium kuwaitense]
MVKQWLPYVWIVAGAAVVAFSFNLFLLPNQIASGGVSGISTLTYELFGWEPAYVQWAINIPLFILGVVLLGRLFGVKTFIGTILLPFFVYLSKDWPPSTLDPLLGGLFGGLGVGSGLGMVFRGGGSTGGTDLVAQIVHRFFGMSLGKAVAIIDGLIVITAAFSFGLERALYALIGLYCTAKAINLVQLGAHVSKTAIIITSKEKEVMKAILEEVDRGITRLTGYGGFTTEERTVLMTVVHQQEFTKLKQTVKREDPSAFIVILDTSEVHGQGFIQA